MFSKTIRRSTKQWYLAAVLTAGYGLLDCVRHAEAAASQASSSTAAISNTCQVMPFLAECSCRPSVFFPSICVPLEAAQVEPRAGQWKTWILTSGSQFRLPGPPSVQQTQQELDALRALASKRDATALDQINYWDAGGPAYRWNEIARNLTTQRLGRDNGPNARALALMNVAIYDAMIAAWDSKYLYNRKRPSDFAPELSTVLPNPKSPSYPSEYGVAAGAASAVLAYLLPNDESFLTQQAQAAVQSRLLAGVEYPSDVTAGLELGRKVAALVIEYAKSDNFSAVWDRQIPTGPGLWRPAAGTTPAGVTGGLWKPWVLSSGSQLRPAPPFAYDSAEKAQEMAQVKNFQRTALSNQAAYFWQFGAHPGGAYLYWNDHVSRKVLEYGLDANHVPPGLMLLKASPTSTPSLPASMPSMLSGRSDRSNWIRY